MLFQFLYFSMVVVAYCNVCSLQTLEMLEKKEKVLLKKAGAEVEKAKEYTRSKNKRGTSLFILKFKLVVCLLLLEYLRCVGFVQRLYSV